MSELSPAEVAAPLAPPGHEPDAPALPVESAPPPAADATEREAVDAEYARLEQLLRNQVGRTRAEQDERKRFERLLREAVERFEQALREAAGREAEALTQDRDRAVGRALEAEAARAELAFRLDELLGHIALATPEARPGAPLELAHARVSGTARGLRSALAEAEEARDMARARLLLAEQDLQQQYGRTRAVERELAEAREQAELELVRARGLAARLERAPDAHELDALQGELTGLRARIAEAESAYESAADAALRGRAHAASCELEMSSMASRISKLNQRLEDEINNHREVGARAAQAAVEIANLSEALDKARGERDRLARASTAQARGEGRLTRALEDARSILLEVSGALDALRGTSSAPPREPPTASFAPTEPGIHPDLGGLEGLEEQVALRDQRIVELSGLLARAQGRLSAVAGAVAELGGTLEAEAPMREQLGKLVALLMNR